MIELAENSKEMPSLLPDRRQLKKEEKSRTRGCGGYWEVASKTLIRGSQKGIRKEAESFRGKKKTGILGKGRLRSGKK